MAFASGAVIPPGTTTNVVTAVNDYFYPTVTKTLFQPQVIQIVVAIASFLITYKIIMLVLKKVSSPQTSSGILSTYTASYERMGMGRSKASEWASLDYYGFPRERLKDAYSRASKSNS